MAQVLHAPDLFSLELDHVLTKKVRRGELSEEEGEEIREALERFPIQKFPSEALRDLAFAMACATGRALYDCLYLALAALHGVRMVTADRKLYDTLVESPLGPYFCWVEDLDASAPEPG